MYRNAYQHGLLTIFSSAGSNPLLIWGLHVKNGHIKTSIDPEIKSQVVDVMGLNVSTTYITCPKDLKQSLGIHLPFLVMIIKNLHKYFTFEITILDQSDCRRRFRVSNFQSTTTIHPFCTAMPIGLSGGWNQIQFNLADFTRRAYKMQFSEVVRVQINANARIRRIYFAERLYAENELPAEYKLYFPVKFSARKSLRPTPMTDIAIAAEAIATEKKTSKENLIAQPSASIKPVSSKATELGKDPSVSKASKVGLQKSAKGSLVTIADLEAQPEKSESVIAAEGKSLEGLQTTDRNDSAGSKKSSKSVHGSVEEKRSIKSASEHAEDVKREEEKEINDVLSAKDVNREEQEEAKEGTDVAGEMGDETVLMEERRPSQLRSLDVIKEETASATKIETASVNKIETASATKIGTASANKIETASANKIETASANKIETASANKIE